jgi:protein gp37
VSANSLIQWTDHTFNPWYGCRKVAPECENCYIVRTVPFRTRGLKHGSDRVKTGADNWRLPYRWNAQARDRETRYKVFCLSLGDWLDDEVPIEWFTELLDVISDTEFLDWQLLTKRPQNWERRLLSAEAKLAGSEDDRLFLWIDDWLKGAISENIWIGVSAGADQHVALEIPARIHFLSCEPMLHALDLSDRENVELLKRFDQIIFGGESGKDAREFRVDWLRMGKAFCRAHGISVFVKQMGHNVVDRNDAGFDGDPGDWPMGTVFRELDSGYQGAPVRLLLKDSHGGAPSEWAEDLRVREFPTCHTSQVTCRSAL